MTIPWRPSDSWVDRSAREGDRLIELTDGSELPFEYGMHSVKKSISAVNETATR